jgi:hypothetical protein
MNPLARAGAVLGALALVAGGCAASPDEPRDVAGTAWSAGCGPMEHPPVQVAGHLIGDADPPGPYTSTPPTSGWHSTNVPQAGEVHDALTDPEIVAALEVGTVVVAMAPDADVDSEVVEDLVAQFPDRLLATTYATAMPAPVALLTWGGMVPCDELTATDVTTFVLTERVSPGGH